MAVQSAYLLYRKWKWCTICLCYIVLYSTKIQHGKRLECIDRITALGFVIIITSGCLITGNSSNFSPKSIKLHCKYARKWIITWNASPLEQLRVFCSGTHCHSRCIVVTKACYYTWAKAKICQLQLGQTANASGRWVRLFSAQMWDVAIANGLRKFRAKVIFIMRHIWCKLPMKQYIIR